MSEDDIVHNLGRINANMAKLNERMNKIDIYIARSEERDQNQLNCSQCITAHTSLIEKRLRVVEDRMIETRPLIDNFGKWIVGVITIGTSMILVFLFGKK